LASPEGQTSITGKARFTSATFYIASLPFQDTPPNGGYTRCRNHLSYLPHSGSVFPQLRDELRGYSLSSGALRFRIGEPLPAPLVEKLVAMRLEQAFPG
jgi:hypothetical protein